MFEQFLNLLQTNPQVAGALTLVVGGAVSYLARDLPRRFWRFIKTQTTCTMEMDNTGDWTGTNRRMDRFEQWYLKNGLTWMSRTFRLDKEGEMMAGIGTNHYFVYKGRLFWFCFRELDSAGVNFRKRELVIKCLSRNQQLIKDFVQEITEEPEQKKMFIDVHALVYLDNQMNWMASFQYPIRSDLVPLVNSGVYAAVEDMLSRFEGNQQWFKENNFPYKRTLLLSGPPGTGKTTLAAQLGMMTGRDIYVVDLNAMFVGTTSGRSLQLLGQIPPGSLILFEDIHAYPGLLKKSPDDEDKSGYPVVPAVSLNSFLNLLNGIVPLDNQIVVMTTNYKEQLDPAVYREGRVDLDLEVSYLDSKAIHNWLERTYGDAAKQYRTVQFQNNLTTGQVFQRFEKHRDDHEAMVQSLKYTAPVKLVQEV